MTSKRIDTLKEMAREQHLVRFARRFETSSTCGYVLDVGPKFFLLAVVSDRIWFDGFECFRIADVSKLRIDPKVEFVETALKKRGERIAKKPRINLENVGELLLSANRAFPLVTIHQELADPDVCWIGRVVDVGLKHVSLLKIHADASWDTIPTEYQLSKVTRVNFGGDYEDALHIVGGKPSG